MPSTLFASWIVSSGSPQLISVSLGGIRAQAARHVSAHVRVTALFGGSCGIRLRRLSGHCSSLRPDTSRLWPLSGCGARLLERCAAASSFRATRGVMACVSGRVLVRSSAVKARFSSAEFTCHAWCEATQPPNQAMQLTASKLVVHASGVCHPRFLPRGGSLGLAAADLVSR